MRLIRWVEGRISGRKSRQKDGSATSIDDQFVYHPSPFRQKISHIATPAHNPPKLHHQLEQRLNEQLNERLSGHFTSAQLNSKLNNSTNETNQQINIQLRRTASALESRSKPKKLLFNRSSEYNRLEANLNEYNPYSLPDNVNNLIENEYENNSQYDNKYNCNYLNQNRYSSITQASNESAFFDYSSSSLIQEFDTPSLGKQRSRIKTNPWLHSPWTSSNSITNNNSLNSNQMENRQFNQYNQLNENQLSLKQNRSNLIANNQLNNQTSVRNSFSFASTASSDSGCVGVNTNSMDASVLSSATNFNESLMSCSMMTNNLFMNDEEILTISHNNGEQIANQINVRNYIEQINYEQDKSFNTNNLNNVPLSSTCEDFSEMSSRAESQLSAIYQQIDELKSKIDEIDLDNGRIEAKMNSLVNFNNQNSKVNLGTKKNDNNFNQHFRLSNCSNYRTTIIAKNNQINSKTNYTVSNSSEEENNVTTSSSYSPASSSSIASSPTSIQNSNSIMNTKQLNTDLLDLKLTTNPISSSSSFNTTTPSSCWSLVSICSSQNIQPASTVAIEKEKNSMSIINEHNELDQNSNQLENVFNYLKQTDSSKLYTQMKYSKILNNPSIGASSVMIRKKGLNNNKFLRKSFDQKQQNINRLSNGSLKNCNESWVSTATDLLLSSDDDDDNNKKTFVNNSNINQPKLTKLESKIIRPESYLKNVTNLIDKRTTVQPQSINNTKQEFNSKLENRNSNQVNYMDNSNRNKQMLLPNYCSNYNSDKDAFKFINENLVDNRTINKSNIKSQIPKPLTPFKINDNYKKLKPIKSSRIPIMKEAILENDIYETIDDQLSNDLYNQPPSPAPIDKYVNKTPIQSIKINRQLPKLPTTKFNCRKLNYNDTSCLISPLTQQLKFEKENQQCKLNYSFRKVNNYYPNQQDVFSSPDSGLDLEESQSSDQNSPSIEQQPKKNLAYQIKNLRYELRGVKKAINEIKDSNLD